MIKKYLTPILIVAGIGLFILLNKNTDSSLGDGTKFSIKNTKEINKLFLAKKSTGKTILLEKNKEGVWILNEKLRANKVMVKTLLETIEKMEVRGPVSKAMRNDAIRDMANMAVKVEVYKNNKVVNVFFVGQNAPDLNGTIMYNQGAENPYIVHIAGFQGFLKTRFLVSEKDWKSKHIFTSKLADIQKLTVNWIETPSKNFEVNKVGLGYKLKGLDSEKINNLKLKAYLKSYEKIFFNGYPLNLNNKQIDSIYNSTPYVIIKLTNANKKERKVAIYHKAIQVDTHEMFDADGNEMAYEEDNFYAFIDDKKEIVEVQLYVMGKIMQEKNFFLK